MSLREGTVSLDILGALIGVYQLASSKGRLFPVIYGVVCILSFSIVWNGVSKNSRKGVLFSLVFGSVAILAGAIIGVYLTLTTDKFSWPFFVSGFINIMFLISVYNYYKELIGLEEGVSRHQLWMLIIHDV